VGVERAELPVGRSDSRLESAPATANAEEIAQRIERREAYLDEKRDGSFSVATAVLRRSKDGDRAPALGMAVVEVNPGGLALRIAAELEEGTHHVYVVEDATECASLDLKARKLAGSPDPSRPDYLGALENVRDGSVRFRRHLGEGVASYRRIVGHPVVLVHARGEDAVCGVLRAVGDEPFEEAISSR
jgi:hypothetical protein